MKILYFSRSCTGHDRRFMDAACGAGHEVRFLALQVSGVSDRDPPGSVEKVDWDRPDPVEESPAGCLPLMESFEAVMKRIDPDVVQAGPVPTCGFMTALAGSRVPSIVVSWASDVLVDAEQGPSWRWATRLALRSADRVLCDADTVRQRIQEYAEIPDDRFIQLPWGTDPDRFHPGEPEDTSDIPFADEENVFRILSTRSWEPIYGIETVLDAFGRALREEPRLRLILLASGSLEDRITGRIRDAGLDEVVARPGFVSRTRLPDFYRAADLYVSAARSDGTSVSLLEAMSSGLPVVVTDHPSNREWVEEGRNGWLASTGDALAFVRAILGAVALSEDDRAAMSRHNRDVIDRRAVWTNNVRRLLDAYAELEPGRDPRAAGVRS